MRRSLSRRIRVHPAAPGFALGRSNLRKRWRDEWNYLMSRPANRARIETAIAELDAWRAAWGFPPFGTRPADDRAA